MQQINDISHYVPPKDSQGGQEDPQVILVFGWLGVALSQLMKYSSKYSNAYPAASQLIIQSDAVAMAVRTTTANQQILEMLAKLGLFGEAPPRMLIHVFSGGGSFQLLWLALALKSKPPPKGAPLTCLVIDSAPGSYHHANYQGVLTYYLSGREYVSGLKRLVGVVLVSFIYIGLKTTWIITGHPTMHAFICEGLANPQIFPWTNSGTSRLYLYSDADQTSFVGDVKAHIAAAKQKGLNIREEYFLGSPHVQHSRVYPERYWAAIRSIWDDTVRSKL
ncbi:hypothetical protein B0H19DRAFT_1267637 [Mycena capillaripes]|nr:hypothetical protein B0H19DRAFT_1267637 [Mycena capillaripes]